MQATEYLRRPEGAGKKVFERSFVTRGPLFSFAQNLLNQKVAGAGDETPGNQGT